jgi:hypothetical protein
MPHAVTALDELPVFSPEEHAQATMQRPTAVMLVTTDFARLGLFIEGLRSCAVYVAARRHVTWALRGRRQSHLGFSVAFSQLDGWEPLPAAREYAQPEQNGAPERRMLAARFRETPWTFCISSCSSAR